LHLSYFWTVHCSCARTSWKSSTAFRSNPPCLLSPDTCSELKEELRASSAWLVSFLFFLPNRSVYLDYFIFQFSKAEYAQHFESRRLLCQKLLFFSPRHSPGDSNF
jgi:hypothetical protein